jgi:hypothetical protein
MSMIAQTTLAMLRSGLWRHVKLHKLLRHQDVYLLLLLFIIYYGNHSRRAESQATQMSSII